MKCHEIRELMPDLAAGLNPVTPETEQHLRACAECAGKLEEFRQTMALLDEWQAPEPSPYFDVRLQARLREEAAKQTSGWLRWFHKPVLAVSLALLMAVGITFFHGDGTGRHASTDVVVNVEPGTAVGDLQALDRNHDMFSDFDVLDDLQVQQNVNANP
jgi:hypothetical protein